MISEVLKIIPKLDTSALTRLERSLSSRFGRVAKRFGAGLKSAILGGGVTALALGVIDKLLNPLKETQDAIDKLLGEADNIATYAEEFKTTTGNLYNLTKLADAKGLEADQLYMLIGKFQSAVADAIKDPSLNTPVRNFAVEGADTAQMFFSFIQALKKLPGADRTVIENQVFGSKQSLKAAEFLNADFNQLISMLRLPNAKQATEKINKTAGLSDIADAAKTQREIDDFLKKTDLISMQNLQLQDLNERLKQQKERDKFGFYESMVRLDNNMLTITAQLEKLLLQAGRGVTSLDILLKKVDKIPGAKLMRGVLGFGKGGD